MTADISVQLTKPANPDLIVRRLGFLHLTPFASPEYLQRFGTPKALADLPMHRIVEQSTDQLNGLGAGLEKLFSKDIAEAMIRVRTNFSSVNYWTIASGAGLGLLPDMPA